MQNVPPHSVSFEFFPPKTSEMEAKLWETILQLEKLSPSFVSVTYGAGGSTRERTHQVVARIARETSLKPAAHLTCVAASRQEVNAVARGYWEAGVRHIVALRGDAPQESVQAGGGYVPHPDGYRYSCELVAGLKKIADFEISVAAFPEKHPDSASFADDIDYLKRKIDAGASSAITQYFFDAELYFRYIERVRAAGISIPIYPGILPVTNLAQVQKFSAMCGASVPKWLGDIFAGVEDEPVACKEISVKVASELCQKLLNFGCEHLHFYTINRADLTEEICQNLQ
jgi:methylenetetrahydrofolate reductase (NADPH)